MPLFLIRNSFEFTQAIYEVVGLIIQCVYFIFGANAMFDFATVLIVTTDDDFPMLVAIFVVRLISWLLVLVVYIVSIVVLLGYRFFSSTSRPRPVQYHFPSECSTRLARSRWST